MMKSGLDGTTGPSGSRGFRKRGLGASMCFPLGIDLHLFDALPV